MDQTEKFMQHLGLETNQQRPEKISDHAIKMSKVFGYSNDNSNENEFEELESAYEVNFTSTLYW